MNWKNEEQYPDYTAGEAMFSVMHPDTERAGMLDDEGCIRLAAAIIRQAMEDHLLAGRKAETEAFFRSGFFRRLTGMNGHTVLRLIREEMRKK